VEPAPKEYFDAEIRVEGGCRPVRASGSQARAKLSECGASTSRPSDSMMIGQLDGGLFPIKPEEPE